MPEYRLLIEGQNVLNTLQGVTQKHGFFTIQTLTSDSLEMAKRMVCKQVEERIIDAAKNNPSDLPRIEVLDSQEVISGHEIKPAQTGLLWYAMENVTESENSQNTIRKQWEHGA